MEFVLATLVNLLSVLVILLLMKYIFGAHFKMNRKITATIAVTFVVFDLILEPIGNMYLQIFMIPVFMLVTLFLLSERRSVKVFFHNLLFILPAILYYVQIDELVLLVGRYLDLNQYTITLRGTPIEWIVLIADVCWVLLLLKVGEESEKKNIDLSLTKGEGMFLLLFTLFFPFYDITYTRLEQEYMGSLYSAGVKMAWVVFCVFLNIAVILFLWNRKKSRFYRSLYITYEKFYQVEYQHFQDYKKSQEEMDRFRHDLNNHFLVVQGLLEKEEHEKAREYISSLSKGFSNKFYPVLSGNDTVDTLIKMKYPLLKEYKIDLKFTGNVDFLNDMAPIDICTIFANLLDNAIEACQKVQEDRYIQLEVKHGKYFHMICLKNPVSSEKKTALFKTEKKEKMLHGHGIGNIRRTLSGYGGNLSYKREGNTVITQVMFYKETIHPSENNRLS